uniref:Uncharacterized protein n=1 Tax=viral metagenome TaxID=1070528 RepID=A0A6C0LSQ1_9ZZZZ
MHFEQFKQIYDNSRIYRIYLNYLDLHRKISIFNFLESVDPMKANLYKIKFNYDEYIYKISEIKKYIHVYQNLINLRNTLENNHHYFHKYLDIFINNNKYIIEELNINVLKTNNDLDDFIHDFANHIYLKVKPYINCCYYISYEENTNLCNLIGISSSFYVDYNESINLSVPNFSIDPLKLSEMSSVEFEKFLNVKFNNEFDIGLFVPELGINYICFDQQSEIKIIGIPKKSKIITSYQNYSNYSNSFKIINHEQLEMKNWFNRLDENGISNIYFIDDLFNMLVESYPQFFHHDMKKKFRKLAFYNSK